MAQSEGHTSETVGKGPDQAFNELAEFVKGESDFASTRDVAKLSGGLHTKFMEVSAQMTAMQEQLGSVQYGINALFVAQNHINDEVHSSVQRPTMSRSSEIGVGDAAPVISSAEPTILELAGRLDALQQNINETLAARNLSGHNTKRDIGSKLEAVVKKVNELVGGVTQISHATGKLAEQLGKFHEQRGGAESFFSGQAFNIEKMMANEVDNPPILPMPAGVVQLGPLLVVPALGAPARGAKGGRESPPVLALNSAFTAFAGPGTSTSFARQAPPPPQALGVKRTAEDVSPNDAGDKRMKLNVSAPTSPSGLSSTSPSGTSTTSPTGSGTTLSCAPPRKLSEKERMEISYMRRHLHEGRFIMVLLDGQALRQMCQITKFGDLDHVNVTPLNPSLGGEIEVKWCDCALPVGYAEGRAKS